MDGEQAISAKGFSEATLATIPPALQAVVDAGDLSGFVTLIWKDGEIAQLNTIGMADIEAGRPMARDTLFRIASMTKPITTVAAMQLVEEGKLSLSDPISKHLPEFQNLKVLKDPQGPVEDTVPNTREITVEDVMTHRAGLAYAFTSVGPIGEAHEAVLGPPLDNPNPPDQWLKKLASLPLSYPPGERFHYSHATEVLGFLVARIEGEPLGKVLKRRIFDKLGMVDTAFHIPKDKRHRAAQIYQAPAEGGLKPVPFADYDESPAYEAGGGGLISTADDYLKFARMLLNDGELDGVRLLKAETVRDMRTNRLTDEQRQVPFLGIPFWMGQGFGLGLSVVVDPEKHAWMGAGNVGAFGWPGAFGTWWQADPQTGMILIYLIQNYMPLGPDSAAVATGQRMGGRAALPVFQKTAYAALGG
ncbi:MAG TPA: serine hydrolase domain-containing protein [Phenylobacterium sp.]|nr:serine hydrolase domain-containing protein [Phenylobacterium sp.]